jgi:hypothetical protein
MVEDDDLPLPRPTEPARSSAPSHTAAFDGDGEFGSMSHWPIAPGFS